jgi:hypothetical protein
VEIHWDVSAILLFILMAVVKGVLLLQKLSLGQGEHERRIDGAERKIEHHGRWLTRAAPDKEPERDR